MMLFLLLLHAALQLLPIVAATLPSYDYVVVGGGTAGLVVANRLSENPHISVLVIEAGPLVTGAREFDELLIPGQVFNQLGPVGQKYDWNITGQPNAELNGRRSAVLTRKVVGGGTSSNAMFFDRGSQRDYDDWATYVGDESWGFDGLLPYFRKLEKFTPPSDELVKSRGVTYDWSAHGRGGYVTSTFQPWMWKSTLYLRSALKALGVPTPKEQGNGNAVGALWVPCSIEPGKWTRSYAKNAYHDRASDRDNYHLLTENTVTRILFQNNKAIGVEYAKDKNAPRRTVRATREVILSAGAVHSPRLLQLSGVGDETHLRKLGIPIVLKSPGVGSLYQDHTQITLGFNLSFPAGEDSSSSTIDPATALTQYLFNRTGPFTAGVGNFAAFLPLPLVTSNAAELIASARCQDPAAFLPKGTHPWVVEGYRRQLRIITSSLATKQAAAFEQVTAIASLQRPLSRGTVKITSRDPFDAPAVDWRTLSNPFDRQVAIAAVKWVRRVFARKELAVGNPIETAPGPAAQSDGEILSWIRQTSEPTFWHHSGTCSMGRSREEGAVVNTNLKVFGLRNLRVIDASIIPVVPATHLQNTVYAIAEKGADLIKDDQ